MKLTTVGDLARCPLAQQWEGALRDLVIRHPNPMSTVELVLTVGNPPELLIRLDVGHDTTEPGREMRPVRVSMATLNFFPGVTLARAWVAAAWTGYMMHEALELVTIGDFTTRPIDPHGDDLGWDKCIREGFPANVTPETLRTALCVVMTPEAADRMMGAACTHAP